MANSLAMSPSASDLPFNTANSEGADVVGTEAERHSAILPLLSPDPQRHEDSQRFPDLLAFTGADRPLQELDIVVRDLVQEVALDTTLDRDPPSHSEWGGVGGDLNRRQVSEVCVVGVDAVNRTLLKSEERLEPLKTVDHLFQPHASLWCVTRIRCDCGPEVVEERPPHQDEGSDMGRLPRESAQLLNCHDVRGPKLPDQGQDVCHLLGWHGDLHLVPEDFDVDANPSQPLIVLGLGDRYWEA